MKTLVIALTVLLAATSVLAQTTTTTTTTTSTTPQATVNTLPPASTCFTCDCNNQDFSCRTPCNAITDFASRQQCLSACDQAQATCLSNAQVQQRAVDTLRQTLQTTGGTSTTGVNSTGSN
ncbi:hypothetical protein [Fundidesulfovibrio terrae]|uniref:hypothetical protein n=1 Tax=Fundidesulfovibrio terrae TaxID=2922866 RepID=UPI001FAF9E7F|nr:hypothetical protein [Fundidesulfovibrio terrae]